VLTEPKNALGQITFY
ncbi:hypothetical protein CISIN_1g0057622mg, partial [Citrus sinensis]